MQDKHSDVPVVKSGWDTTSWMLVPGGYIVCDRSIVGWKGPGKAKVTQLQLSHSSIAYRRKCTNSCKINSPVTIMQSQFVVEQKKHKKQGMHLDSKKYLC